MSNRDRDPSSQNSSKEFDDFNTTKNSLIRYYQNIASSQTIRLLGFTAGLFTLIGAVQISIGETLLDEFILTQIELFSPGLISAAKFGILLLATLILSYFIIRAIFRYAAYANLADAIIYVTLDEVTKVKGLTLHDKIFYVGVAMKNREVFGKPLSYFINYQGNKNLKKGLRITRFSSILATVLLMILIW